MADQGPVELLAEVLRETNARLSISTERFARSASYDVNYRTAIVAMVIATCGKSLAPRHRSLAGSRLKLFQFIAIRPWLVDMVREWSATRRSGQFSMFSAHRLRRGYLGDSTHDRIIDLLVALRAVEWKSGNVVAPEDGLLGRLNDALARQELFLAEREAVKELSDITITTRMLEGR